MNDEQVLKLLADPENHVRQVTQAVVAEQQVETSGPEGFMSVKSAARHPDVDEGTIRKWLQRGHVSRYKACGCVRIEVAEILRQG